MNKVFLKVLVSCILFSFLSCGKNSSAPLSEANPILRGTESIIAGSGGLDGRLAPYQNYALVVQKSVIEDEHRFLLRTQLNAPSPSPLRYPKSSMAPMIVYFKKNGTKLALFEDSKGYKISDNFATEELMTKFSIIKEDALSYTIDFGAGMSQLFLSPIIWDRKYDDFYEVGSVMQAQVQTQYTHEISLENDNLFIHQSVRLALDNSFPLDVLYTFSSYVDSTDFKPQVAPKKFSDRFFETRARKVNESDEKKRPHMMINPLKDGKLTYYYTRTTPEEYKSAVVDGVLYWNQVFKANGIEAEIDAKELPEGVNPDNPRYNVIHWWDNDESYFAYANFEADPKTGAIIRSTVHFPSSFVRYAKKEFEGKIRSTFFDDNDEELFDEDPIEEAEKKLDQSIHSDVVKYNEKRLAMGVHAPESAFYMDKKSLDHVHEKESLKKSNMIQIAGMMPAPGCEKNLEFKAPQLEKYLTALAIGLNASSDSDDEMDEEEREEKEPIEEKAQLVLDRFIKDYITATIAHEVGHTLGLHHNFAAATDTNLKFSNYKPIVNSYLVDDRVPEKLKTTGSVMDYLPGEIHALTGAQIRKKAYIGAYDKEMIAWGYKREMPDFKKEPFCSNMDAYEGTYTDCAPFIGLKDPIENAALGIESRLDEMTFQMAKLVRRTLRSKDFDMEKIGDIHNKLPIQRFALLAAFAVSDLAVALDTRTTSLRMDRLFGEVTIYNKEEAAEQRSIDRTKALDTMGGLSKILFDRMVPIKRDDENFRSDFVERSYKLFHKVIPHLVDFSAFSETDAASLKESLTKIFPIFERQFLSFASILLRDAQLGIKYSDELADSIVKLVDSVTLSDSMKELFLIEDFQILEPLYHYRNEYVIRVWFMVFRIPMNTRTDIANLMSVPLLDSRENFNLHLRNRSQDVGKKKLEAARDLKKLADGHKAYQAFQEFVMDELSIARLITGTFVY